MAAGDEEIELTEEPVVPFQPGTPPGLVSEDGSVAYTLLTLPTDFDKSADWGRAPARSSKRSTPDGLTVLLSGDLGFFADAKEVFGELDAKLLLATVLLVLVLLGAIYRAVLVAMTPIIVVFFAYTIAQRLHLPLRGVRRGRLLERDGDPDRPLIRGGDRLLPAPRVEIQGGAPPPRGQARGDGACPAPIRPGDPRERPDGRSGDAGPGDRRLTQHQHPRPHRRDRRRVGDGRGADPAARPAHDLRPRRVLAPQGQRRL